MCKTTCTHCPFAFSDASEYVQGLGCLPEPSDILRMKRETGHNWACHADETKLCKGFARHAKQYAPELDLKSGGLISYTTWYYHGEEQAIAQAERRARPLDDAQLIPLQTLPAMSREQYEQLDRELQGIGMAFAKGEELPGYDERADEINQLLDNSGWYRNMDTGQLQDHPYA